MNKDQQINRLTKDLEFVSQEKEQLLEFSEEMKVLERVSRRIDFLEDEGLILNELLETICLLKDIAYASFLKRKGNRYVVVR